MTLKQSRFPLINPCFLSEQPRPPLKTHPRRKARRWVVEVTHSWFNRFRKLLVRYEKFTETYEALLHMAAAMIAFRKAGVIYG
jgi:IS5 family transposase